MLISSSDMLAQFDRAVRRWPYLVKIARKNNVSALWLFAVGSVETNLSERYTQGNTGDGGHGHGMFQLDDRYHTPPGGSWWRFDRSAKLQGKKAAAMLHSLYNSMARNRHCASSAYNCGVGGAQSGRDNHGDCDYFTTKLGTQRVGYGREVMDRYEFLHAHRRIPGWWHRNLRVGHRGDDVARLKNLLRQKGYSKITKSKFYGHAVKRAVASEQRRHGLLVTGRCDAPTAGKLQF